MKSLIKSSFIFILTFLQNIVATSQTTIDVETGVVFAGYNNVRIPGDQGTRFSLKDDLKPETQYFHRLRASYTWKSRHTLSLLYAPLKINSEGRVTKDILFEYVLFPTNTELKGTYKFNSYRLTYRYDLVSKSKIIFGVGITAKIRDAGISLSSSDSHSEKTNVGFVPILNFRSWLRPTDTFGILLDGDALAAPQGRAEDVLLAASYNVSENMVVRAGYRILEGGADNDEVYNFALFHYALVGISYTFQNRPNLD